MAARIAVVDIERQSGIVEGVWGLKQNGWLNPGQFLEPPRTICLAWKWLGEDEIGFAAEWNRGGHAGMVKKAHAVMDEADYIVGWNSRGFDVKHLKSEFILHDMKPPAPHKDVDLMQVAKRNFGFLSNRMNYIAEQLNCGSKVQTGGSNLWSKLRHAKGDELREARELMERYNRQDVVLTEELYNLMLPWVSGLNLAAYADGERTGPVCPNCESLDVQYRGFQVTSTRRYQRFQCQQCGRWGRSVASVGSVDSTGA
jgi:hypothetical protein